MSLKRVLTIAGSDSGGGAGIQADLKTITTLGAFGMSVLTALTAQNTIGVQAIHAAPAEFIEQQFDSVATDIGIDAVKTGMLADAAVIEIVARKIKMYAVEKLVVDPVMTAKGGSRLLREDATEALIKLLLPLAYVVTPNTPEAEVLSGMAIRSIEDMQRAARKIKDLGPRSVIIKGGHLEGDAVDLLFDGSKFTKLTSPRFRTTDTHGTGCTYSAAIATGLAQGMPLLEAVKRAKIYVATAIKFALRLGAGHGPTDHLAYLTHESERVACTFDDEFSESVAVSERVDTQRAFKKEAEDFDLWFKKNEVVFGSELAALSHFITDPKATVSIGCGSGIFDARLGITQGVEPAEGMAELARRRGLIVHIGTAEQLPLTDASASNILLGTILSYVGDPQKAVNEAYRVLKNEGHIIISYLPREGSYTMLYDLALLRGNFDPETAPDFPYPLKFIAGARWCSTRQIIQWLTTAGFVDLQFVQTLTRHPKYSNTEIEQPISGYDCGDYVVVKARKP